MIRTVHLVQLVIGFLGFGLAIAAFWLGDYFNWSLEIEIFVAISATLATILFELIISVISLRESITKLYPSLDFSVEEQKEVYGVISDLLKLRTREPHPFATLALESHRKSLGTIRRAVANNDYNIENMFEAILVTMKMLKPNEHWLGLSSIINPDYWKYDAHLQEYKELNYQQVKNGVIIKRIFLLSDQDEYSAMEVILKEQSDNGIHVYFAMIDDLKGLSYFPDITIFPEHNFGMYTPSKDKLLICHATINPSILSQMRNDFEKILDRATKFT